MRQPRRIFPLLILPAFLLSACAPDMQALLSEDDTRARTIETLVHDPSMRGDVIESVLSTPDGREAMLAGIVKDEQVAGALIERMMRGERSQAVAVSHIASDTETTRKFIGLMMLTGSVGRILDQQQAECLGLGEAFAQGNQRQTMVDLRRLGKVVDAWARANQGRYPVCSHFEDVTGCLASSLPDGAFADLSVYDAWGKPFQYHSEEDGSSYVLLSYATDGQYDGLGRAGPTSSYNADIVFSDGKFVQWPGHILKDTIR